MPMFENLFASRRSTLSPQQALKFATVLLAAAGNADDSAIALALCSQAELSLDRVKIPQKSSATESADYQIFRDEVAAAYLEHARFMAVWRHYEKEQASRNKCEKWKGQPAKYKATAKGKVIAAGDTASISERIFDKDVSPPGASCVLPEVNKPLADTPQLAYALTVLSAVTSSDDVTDLATHEWLEATVKDPEEQKRLRDLVKNLVRAFQRDELKDADAVAEVTYVAPFLETSDFRFLLAHFVDGLERSALLDVHSLEGLSRLLQSTAPDALKPDDLIKTLGCMNKRLQVTHKQSQDYVYQLTTTISRVLDAMADSLVEGLEREGLHLPLQNYLEGLKKSDDAYMVFHAAYAFQALLCVPDDESLWQGRKRQATAVAKGVFRVVSAVRALDVNKFIDGLVSLQEGLEGVHYVAEMAKGAYDDIKSLYKSGQELRDALQEGLSFDRKRTWYAALRGLDTLLQNGRLMEFKKVVCEAPCRRALAFQWGVCLRLGNLAVDSQWDDGCRHGAIAFLGQLYRDDKQWGHHVPVKKLILDILIQLSKPPKSVAQGIRVQRKTHRRLWLMMSDCSGYQGANSAPSLKLVIHRIAAESLLTELENDEKLSKRAMFKAFQESGPSSHPLMAAMPPLASSPLLDRVQGKLDVEADLKRIKLTREKLRGRAVYIPPQAKDNLQASDKDLFDLMDKAKEFLASKEKSVFLLLGESGVGKTTFNMELESILWRDYKSKVGRIPLFISLPAIVRPEQDLIVKHLRKAQFEESQIRELKDRTFVLICDGYDESQQTHNLYTSNRLNQEGEWKAQMVISCRSEYVGLDYKHRFQPGDRNQSTSPGQFQEAVVMPFDWAQVEVYITSFVDLKKSVWSAADYTSVLEQIPSLRELVKNPFLLTLSLEVLPRLVDPNRNNLSATKVTRVALYDEFVEQWLERSKKRQVDKDLIGQERKVFERLSDEGFTRNGIAFLKKLATAVYERQGGNPVIEYSHMEDVETWKDGFLGHEDDKQLLREACPLVRSGNQYRFIHRSILEYGLARAVFEPQNGGIGVKKATEAIDTPKRRGSAYSFEIEATLEDIAASTVQGPDEKSPLFRKSYVREPSILQFLEERVQQEPLFKEQLLAYIQSSKSDKKWRIAAANAITILVRARVQFNGKDLQRIQIPGADLSFGVFDSAQLQGADLRKVNLSNVWLGRANLSEARMSGVEFGELPYLQEAEAVSCCVYSPDGKTLASFFTNGGVSLYSTLTWEKKWGLGRAIKIDPDIAFSPNSDLIAFFNKDGKDVQLWETDTGTCRHTLRGHTERITGIAYSPKGDLIASCGDDKTIRLWDIATGVYIRILDGYQQSEQCIAFSPKGDQIASGDATNGTMRLWDIETGACFETHGRSNVGSIKWVLYSPKGTKIASHFCDNYNWYLLLWDVESRTSVMTRLGYLPRSTAFSPSDESIAVLRFDGKIIVLNPDTGESRQVMEPDNGQFLSMAYSPKGDLIATGGEDQAVQLWDVETGACRRSINGHSGAIRSVAFSLDGRQIASGSDDKRVRLWEVESGTNGTSSGGLSHTVLSVGHSSHGECILSASGQEAVHVWDMQTGECRQTLTVHEAQDISFPTGKRAQFWSVAHSASGGQFASGSRDGKVRLWSTETGACLSILGGHECKFQNVWVLNSADDSINCCHHNSNVSCIAYSPKGDWVASGSYDKSVRIWDTETGLCRYDFSGHGESLHISLVAYSPKADQFASAARFGDTVLLWDVEVGTCHILQGHTSDIRSIMYSPGGGEIASSSNDDTVRLWDTETGLCRHILRGHENSVLQALYSPNGDQIASSSWDKTIRLWDVQTGISSIIIHAERHVRIAYSPAGDFIASTDDDGTVRLWDVETGISRFVLQGNDEEVQEIVFSPRGDLVASCSDRRIVLLDIATGEHRRNFSGVYSGVTVFSPAGSQIVCLDDTAAVQVWDVETGECIHTLSHEKVVHDIKYSAEGDLIGSASEDMTVRLWDAETGACLHTLLHRSQVYCLAFSPQGDRIISGSEDAAVRLWDTRSGTRHRPFGGHADRVNCVVFSPNGRQLASGGDDNSVLLWDLDFTSCRRARTFEGHTESVQCLAYSPKDNQIASGSKDKSIRLWEIEDGTCHRTMTGITDEIWCVAYSPNGDMIASGSSNMSVWLWDVTSGQARTVIEGSYGNLTGIAWRTTDDNSYLVTGCSDKSVRVWNLEQEEDGQYRAALYWSSSHGTLVVAGTDLQGARGLSGPNKQLLKQRGAVCDPELLMTAQMMSTVGSVASKFKQGLKNKTATSSSTLASSARQSATSEE